MRNTSMQRYSLEWIYVYDPMIISKQCWRFQLYHYHMSIIMYRYLEKHSNLNTHSIYVFCIVKKWTQHWILRLCLSVREPSRFLLQSCSMHLMVFFTAALYSNYRHIGLILLNLCKYRNFRIFQSTRAALLFLELIAQPCRNHYVIKDGLLPSQYHLASSS